MTSAHQRDESALRQPRGVGDAAGIKKRPFVLRRGVAMLLDSYKDKRQRWALESSQAWTNNALQDFEARSDLCARQVAQKDGFLVKVEAHKAHISR